MTCCIKKISLCIGQWNDKAFLFTAYDQTGALLDVSDASEITFIVASQVNGTILLTKTLSGGSVILSNAHQFRVEITAAESGALAADTLYCEVGLVNSGGDKYTLGAGPFKVEDTRIWDN